MHIAWGPFIPAAVTGGIAAVLYLTGWLPRAHGIFAAITAVFLAAGTGLLALAHHAAASGPHHKVSPGPWQVAILLGAALSIGLFVWIVICGNHGKPVLKMRRRPSGGGAPGAAGTAGKGSHPKAAHHRSAVITVLAVGFSMLLVFNWGPLWQLGTGGLSQTGSSITGGT